MSENNALSTSATWSRIAETIAEATGSPFRARSVTDIGGGCINRAVKLSDRRRSFFVKLNDPPAADVFEAERDGLAALGASGAVRVPTPLATGTLASSSFLVLEFIPLRPLSRRGWAALGERLAGVHRHTALQFGWQRSNTIGATPQINHWTPGWLDFWRRYRLGQQLEIAEATRPRPGP